MTLPFNAFDLALVYAAAPTLCSRSPEIVDLDLPRPQEPAQAHSDQLVRHIRQIINAQGGWISFAEYMQEALYAPGLGYYSAGATKFGGDGDFVTAPEISPLFSRCVANQCAQVLLATGGSMVVEPGAGTGAMAAQILRTLELLGALPEQYLIIEPSADLRQRQQQAIAEVVPDLVDRVSWPDQPPEEIDGIIIGNEVLDALPCERFQVFEGVISNLGVGCPNDGLAELPRPADEQLEKQVRDIAADAGWSLSRRRYQSEVRPQMGEFIRDWAQRLRLGAMLWIDYGATRSDYYSLQRCEGTLRCHYRHRAHDDPFLYPGLQDITAWVDFTDVAEAAVDAGLTLSGYTTQAHFLVGCGIEQQFTAMRAQAADDRAEAELSAATQQLLMPGQMGETVKVIALERDLKTEMIGFKSRDLAASL